MKDALEQEAREMTIRDLRLCPGDVLNVERCRNS